MSAKTDSELIWEAHSSSDPVGNGKAGRYWDVQAGPGFDQTPKATLLTKAKFFATLGNYEELFLKGGVHHELQKFGPTIAFASWKVDTGWLILTNTTLDASSIATHAYSTLMDGKARGIEAPTQYGR